MCWSHGCQIPVLTTSSHIRPQNWVVADFGCGEATLSLRVPQKKVHSLDLVAANSRVTVCDMAHSHLPPASVDVVVFCLSLMGNNIKDFILEASRVLKVGYVSTVCVVVGLQKLQYSPLTFFYPVNIFILLDLRGNSIDRLTKS